MPIRIQFTDGGLGIVLRGSGSISGAELTNAHKVFVHKHLKTIAIWRYWLIDFSDAGPIQVSVDEIHLLAHQTSRVPKSASTRYVAVCAPGDLGYGLARMWQAAADRSGRIQVFREAEEAKEWLREAVKENLTFE